ncbi:MAG: TonB-dependent receptor [Bacteroidales bacterium]
MRKLFSFLIGLSIVFNGFAQSSDANVTGHVVDSETGAHLPFIDVVVVGTTIGTTTDATGHFFLKNLPLGIYILKASSIGYTSDEKKVELKKGKTINIFFNITEDAILLQGTVVSANKNDTKRGEAPAIVNLITPKMFERANATCLSDGLNFQPGLRMENDCQNCGYQQVRINGLEGNYSQILIDNRPVSSALAGIYGLEQIPINLIEKVEVIRGGGSALFGANAIAGTVNIITKKAFSNSVKISNNTSLIGMDTFDNNTSLNASLVTDNCKAGVSLFASARARNPYDADGDGYSELGKIRSKTLGLRGYYRTSNNTKLSYEYHNINEFRRGGNKFDLQPFETEITEQLKHDINTGSVAYDIFLDNNKHWIQLYSSIQHVDRDSYYGANFDLNAYGKTEDMTNVDGIQYVLNMDKCLFMSATLTTGIEYKYSYLRDKMLGYGRDMTQEINLYSAFAQNEWKNKKISLLIGGRVDKTSVLDNPIFSPRTTVRYTLVKNLVLRASFGTGFRAPQTYNEDLHVEAVGGVVKLISNSPDLKTEHSNTYSLSVDYHKIWKGGGLTFLIEGFYTNLKDVFKLEENGVDTNGNLLMQRVNGSGAKVMGTNIEAMLVPHRGLEIQAGVTYQKSRYDKAEKWSDDVVSQRRMFRTPDFYGYITASYVITSDLELSVNGTYTGEMLVQHLAGYIPKDIEQLTPDFFDMGIKVNYDFKLGQCSHINVHTGIKNIFNSYQSDFDKGATRDASYIYGPIYPRTVYLGIDYKF